LAWNPNGTILAFGGRNPNTGVRGLYFKEKSATSARLVLRYNNDSPIAGLDWSPDGQRIAFNIKFIKTVVFYADNLTLIH